MLNSNVLSREKQESKNNLSERYQNIKNNQDFLSQRKKAALEDAKVKEEANIKVVEKILAKPAVKHTDMSAKQNVKGITLESLPVANKGLKV